MKYKFTEWEKIFVNYTFEKRYLPRIYKDIMEHNIKKKKKSKDPIKKWIEVINLTFHWRGYIDGK